MKFKTTAKAIKASGGNIMSIGYCDAWHLLRDHNPIAYTCGIYGWNFDVYEINGITICTGYRGMPGRKANNVREYEQKAKALYNDWNTPHEERKQQLKKLLDEFLKQA